MHKHTYRRRSLMKTCEECSLSKSLNYLLKRCEVGGFITQTQYLPVQNSCFLWFSFNPISKLAKCLIIWFNNINWTHWFNHIFSWFVSKNMLIMNTSGIGLSNSTSPDNRFICSINIPDGMMTVDIVGKLGIQYSQLIQTLFWSISFQIRAINISKVFAINHQ